MECLLTQDPEETCLSMAQMAQQAPLCWAQAGGRGRAVGSTVTTQGPWGPTPPSSSRGPKALRSLALAPALPQGLAILCAPGPSKGCSCQQITFQQPQCGELCVQVRGWGAVIGSEAFSARPRGQERGLGWVHLSREHQVSARSRAGLEEGWRGEDSGGQVPRGLQASGRWHLPLLRPVACEKPLGCPGSQLPLCQKGRADPCTPQTGSETAAKSGKGVLLRLETGQVPTGRSGLRGWQILMWFSGSDRMHGGGGQGAMAAEGFEPRRLLSWQCPSLSLDPAPYPHPSGSGGHGRTIPSPHQLPSSRAAGHCVFAFSRFQCPGWGWLEYRRLCGLCSDTCPPPSVPSWSLALSTVWMV